MRTGVNIIEKFDIQNIIKAVKANHFLVTNGPVIDLSIQNESGQAAVIGDEIQGEQFVLNIKAKSTDEFGKLELIHLIRGDLITKKEISEKVIKNFSNPYHFQWEQKLIDLSKRTYFRAELTTQKTDGQIARCFTNPIWVIL